MLTIQDSDQPYIPTNLRLSFMEQHNFNMSISSLIDDVTVLFLTFRIVH